MTNPNTAALNTDASEEDLVAMLENLAQAMLGGMVLTPQETPDVSGMEAEHIFDGSVYRRLEEATDSLTDAMEGLKKGRSKIDEALCVVQKVGFADEELDKRITMLKIVDQAITNAFNTLVDIKSDMVASISRA